MLRLTGRGFRLSSKDREWAEPTTFSADLPSIIREPARQGARASSTRHNAVVNHTRSDAPATSPQIAFDRGALELARGATRAELKRALAEKLAAVEGAPMVELDKSVLARDLPSGCDP